MTAKIQTWTRDSFELLDYDATDVTKTIIKTKKTCYLIRTNTIPFFEQNPFSIDPKNLRFLSKIQEIDSSFHIGHFSITPVTTIDEKSLHRDQYEKLWLVVKSLKTKQQTSGYLLGEGDVIRIGRCKFRIKELKSTAIEGIENFSLCGMLSPGDEEENEADEPTETARTFVLPCRICLSEVYEPENPLISPCKCGGTMKYIHLKCLQHCLMSKLTTKSSDCVLSFSWKKLGCDLCKKTYPYKLLLHGTTVDLLEIPKPPGQYLILEVLCKDKNSQKGLHVVHMGQKATVRIGRAQESELRISDISVSRNHAQINYVGGNFYLEDTGSKFGTLVQIKRPILLDEHKELTVQSGRSLITYSLKMPWSIIPACFRSSNFMEGALSSRGLPILPINTGIPASVCDPYLLLAFAGMPIKNNEKYKQHSNLLYEHNQLGANSSYEADEHQSIESVEEVEIAEMSEEILGEETNRFENPDFKENLE